MCVIYFFVLRSQGLNKKSVFFLWSTYLVIDTKLFLLIKMVCQ